jgi:hypothetical protein
MRIGFARKFKSLDPDYLTYQDIWSLVASTLPTKTIPKGSGIYVDPYQPLGISDWFYLSQEEVGDGPTFIRVADRLIVKWGGDAGVLKSYTSDVTDIPIEQYMTQDEYAKATKAAGEKSDIDRGYDVKKETVYTRKARRVDKVYSTAAVKARELLWGHTSGDPDAIELANTITGLLISEGGADRDKSNGAVFMATFMLLDLIEKQIRYGRNRQTFTWASMLMHAGAGQNQPAPAVIRGRGPDKGHKRDLAKHPMAGVGTVALGKNISQNAANEVRNRVVSIAAAWLANNLAEDDSDKDYKYYLVRSDAREFKPKSKAPLRAYEHLREMSRIALRMRAGSTACLLTGSQNENIGYMDDQGKVIPN